MKRRLLVAVLLLFVCTVTNSPIFAQDDVDKIKQNLEAISKKMIQAIVDGDLKTIMAYYADDVISMPNYGEMVKGKEAMLKYQEEMQKEGVKFNSMNFTMHEVWTCGEMIYEIGTYGLSMTTPETPYPIADKGKYLTIWEKQQDGSLKIKVETWNTDMNPWKMMAEHN